MSDSDELITDDYSECTNSDSEKSESCSGSDDEKSACSESSVSCDEYLSDDLSDEEPLPVPKRNNATRQKSVAKNVSFPKSTPKAAGNKQSKALGLMGSSEIKNVIKNGVTKARYVKNLSSDDEVPVKKTRGRPVGSFSKKPPPAKRVICKTCGKEYTRNNVTAHKDTQWHMAYKNMNKTLREILLNK